MMGCHKERCRFCQHETVENKVCFWCGLDQTIEIEEPEPENFKTGRDCSFADMINQWQSTS